MTREEVEKTLERFKEVDGTYRIGSAKLEITDTDLRYVLLSAGTKTCVSGGCELDKLKIEIEYKYGMVFVTFSYSYHLSGFTVSKEIK